MQKSMKQSIPAKVLALVLILLMVFAVALPVFQGIDVKAESDVFSNSTKVYVNDDNYPAFGDDVTLYAICYDTSGNVITDGNGESKCALKADGEGYYFTAYGGTATFELVRENTTLIENTPVEPITGIKRRIFFNNTSNMSDVYAYTWFMDGSSAIKGLGEWPGTKMKSVTGNYYYIDVPMTDTHIIFNDGRKSGATQTDSITISEDKDLYTANTNRWTTFGIKSVVEVSVDARPNDTANTIYVTGASTYKWSKYASPLSTAMTTVYVYAPAWNKAYVTYDPNDPLTIVTELENVTTEGTVTSADTGYFIAQVPEGSTFMFRPNKDDTAATTGKLSNISEFTKPCYNVTTKTWMQLGEEAVVADYVVSNTFNKTNILGVKATYYDYLSDEEHNDAWLKPKQNGTGFNGAEDDWYPFYIFNQKLSTVAKSNAGSWKYPLYFGNFCNTPGAYDKEHGSGSGRWSHVTSDTNAYNFHYLPNNSNALTDNTASVQGLMKPSLSSDGKLMVTDSLAAPYFDNQWLIDNELAKVISGDFPFVITDHGAYKEYSFDSNNAKDNVYFTWDTEGSHTYPTKINYGAGTSYGITDGIQYFMSPESGEKSGYGIFPFNNRTGTEGEKTHSNKNLNYGFGIRMDIDFRVPEGGVVPGTNQAIEFNFEGDDDLWVYITDTETNESKLLLDMGGAHKKSVGSINFRDEVATVKKAYSVGQQTTVTGDRYVYFANNYNWSNLKAYFMDANKNKIGTSWPGDSMSASGNDFKAKIPSGAAFVIVSGSGGQTIDIDLRDTNGAYYPSGWDNGKATVGYWEQTPSDAGISGQASSGYTENAKYDFSSFFDNTDDQKTYTMTVFYMERGLIESNMKINFTMTPLDNDLTVSNQVNTTHLNPAIREILSLNEKFEYTIENPKGVDGIVYDDEGNATDNGKFYLGSGNSAFFDAVFDTGSDTKVTEVTQSLSGIKYDTTWQLYDNNTGVEIQNSEDDNNKTTADFELINPSGDSNYKTSLYLGYVNTPQSAPITVTKAIEDELGKEITDSTAVFDYTIYADITEGDNLVTYNLEYDLYGKDGSLIGTFTAMDGKFSLQAGQKAEFTGMPVGAVYKVVESVKNGYTIGSISAGSTAEVEGYSVTDEIGETNEIAYTNIYKPVKAALKAYKNLAGSAYTGTDFTFKLQGIDSFNLDSDKTISTKDVSLTVSDVANGEIAFSNTTEYSPFTYSDEGVYCYKISEVNDGKAGYIYDDAVYYAKIVVTADGDGVLTVNDPVYYSDSAFSKEITASDVLFENEYKPVEAELNLNKTLDDVLYSGTDFEFKAEGVSENTSGASMTVNVAENGIVTFKNTTENKMFTYTKPGTYCYKLYEVKDENNMDYIFDETVYYAKVTVTAGEEGVLSTAVSYFTDSAFNNITTDVTIANESALCTVYVYKKSSLNGTTSLAGAEFELRIASPDEAGGWVEDTDSDFRVGSQTTAEIELENGEKVIAAKFENVPQGDYVVVETKAPMGYELSALTPYVNVRKTAENSAEIHIDFIDYESQPLPMTGGSGFALGTAAAIALLGMAAICWLASKKSSKKDA